MAAAVRSGAFVAARAERRSLSLKMRLCCFDGGRACRAPSREALAEEPMKPLIMAIVQALVDKPEEVQIKEVIGDHAHVLELRVAKEDLGKVIGKGGAHASAIRTLMAATSGKEKKRYILEIIEY